MRIVIEIDDKGAASAQLLPGSGAASDGVVMDTGIGPLAGSAVDAGPAPSGPGAAADAGMLAAAPAHGVSGAGQSAGAAPQV